MYFTPELIAFEQQNFSEINVNKSSNTAKKMSYWIKNGERLIKFSEL